MTSSKSFLYWRYDEDEEKVAPIMKVGRELRSGQNIFCTFEAQRHNDIKSSSSYSNVVLLENKRYALL